MEIVERDRSLALGAGKQKALLAILLLNANEVVSTDRLHDELWGESPPATAAKSIQLYVSRLRKELGEGRLVTRPPGYVLKVEPHELDAARFRRLVGEARNIEPERAARKLREALDLWRGPPLADLEYEPFAQSEIARMRGPCAGAPANSGPVSDQRPWTCGAPGRLRRAKRLPAWRSPFATESFGARSGANASLVASPAQARSQSAS